jgi:hypothetical protein
MDRIKAEIRGMAETLGCTAYGLDASQKQVVRV